MALTLTEDKRTVHGDQDVVVYKVDFDSSYPTGGEALTPSDLGLRNIDLVVPTSKDGHVFEYDYSNEKLQAFWADYDAAADGALIEVADATDLSSVTDARLLVFGQRQD